MAAQRRLVWTALGIVYVVWGSTYLAIHYLVATVPPFLAAGSRYTIAGLIMVAVVAARRGTPALGAAPRVLGASALAGALLLLGGNGLVMLAERSIDSHLAALVVASVPLFVIVLRLASRERVHAATLGGVVLGFAGLAVLMQPGAGTGGGILVVLGASLSWSVGSWLSPRLPLPADPLANTAYEMVFGGVLLLCASAARGEWSHFSIGHVTLSSWLALAYLVVFGSLIAFTAFVWLLQAAPISTVSTYAYVNPAVAVVLGAVAGETLGWRSLVGGAVVIAAVAVVVTTEAGLKRRRAPAEPPEPVLTTADR